MFCAICEACFVIDAIDFGYCSEPICEGCLSSYMRLDDEIIPEVGDTAEFLSSDEFGLVQTSGVIMKIFKNGNVIIQKDGRPFRTHYYYVLGKAA